MHNDPFSTQKAKRSLNYFAIGKVVSAVLGLSMLVLLVRCMAPAEYGAYITLIACMEIALLVSNAGCYSVAQRYVTEARLARYLHHLPGLIWKAISYRVITVLGFFLLLTPFLHEITQKLGIDVSPTTVLVFAVFVMFEGVARYIELVFEALLEQVRTQMSTILRNASRLAAVTFIYFTAHQVSLETLILIECAASTLAALLAFHLVRRYLRKIAPQARSVPEASEGQQHFSLRRMLKYALPHYFAQSVFQLYSPDAAKIITMRTMGALEAASFGFAHAISFVLQRYLPAQLLIGLIRPLFVARKADGAGDDELARMANFVLKINNFLIAPAIAFFALHGTAFSDWLSKGKQVSAGEILPILMVLLILQGLHIVLGMICAALEDGRSILIATVSAIPGMGIGLLTAQWWGAAGMALGLCMCEFLWCAVLWMLIGKRGFVMPFDWKAWSKLAVAGGIACGASWGLGRVLSPEQLSPFMILAIQATVTGCSYLAACFVLKPFNEQERARINSMLPRPVFQF